MFCQLFDFCRIRELSYATNVKIPNFSKKNFSPPSLSHVQNHFPRATGYHPVFIILVNASLRDVTVPFPSSVRKSLRSREGGRECRPFPFRPEISFQLESGDGCVGFEDSPTPSLHPFRYVSSLSFFDVVVVADDVRKSERVERVF